MANGMRGESTRRESVETCSRGGVVIIEDVDDLPVVHKGHATKISPLQFAAVVLLVDLAVVEHLTVDAGIVHGERPFLLAIGTQRLTRYLTLAEFEKPVGQLTI